MFDNILLSVSWILPTIVVMWIQERCLFLDASILQWGWLRQSLLETSGLWLSFYVYSDILRHIFLSCGMLPCQETGSSSGIFFSDGSDSQEMNRYLHSGIVRIAACRFPQGKRTKPCEYVILLPVWMVYCPSPPILHEFWSRNWICFHPLQPPSSPVFCMPDNPCFFKNVSLSSFFEKAYLDRGFI